MLQSINTKLQEGLSGKKILFFSVQTFNLEKEIKNKMEEFGAQVTFYDERPANNNFVKGIIRLKRSFYQKKIDAYYDEVLKKINGVEYDFLFVNRGEVITASFLEKFKSRQPKCEMIFYTWDSFANHSHPTELLSFFDKKFTFDRKDAKQFNIGFRPLFYLDKYKNPKSSKSYKYDLLFLGTAHSDRYLVSSRVADLCQNLGLKSHIFYYMQSRLVYFYKKMFDQSFKEFDYKKLSFESLSSDELVALYNSSKVILDINHPMQNGLTMRTFEAIGAKKKLITTNEDVKNYPFYSPNNFFVIDRENIVLNRNFFETDYSELNSDLYIKCSLEGWMYDVFIGSENEDWKEFMSEADQL